MSEYKRDYCHHDSLTAQNTYIKREDMLKVARSWICTAGVKDDLESIPSADVVEVVRCKDCKHHEELLNNNDGNVLCWVHDIDVIVDENGYCSYGERKEQEHE